ERSIKGRTLSLSEVKSQDHRVGNGENVREQDCRIQRETLEGLQRHFSCERGRFAQGEEAPRAAPRLVIFGKVAPRLAHQPNRRVRGRLPEQRPYQRVVLQRSHRLTASSGGA